MRVAILVGPGAVSPPLPELPMLLQGFAQWREQWRAKMELFQFWAGRPGGMAVLNVDDEQELSQMMFEFPLTPYATIDVRPVVDGDDALQRLTQTVEGILAQMQPG